MALTLCVLEIERHRAVLQSTGRVCCQGTPAWLGLVIDIRHDIWSSRRGSVVNETDEEP